jgi:DNA-binding PadR family transcriptional regulator
MVMLASPPDRGVAVPIHHAILALLADGPSHGYELRGAFDAAVGPQWGALNIGHLYQVLDRLGRDGHVRSNRVAQDVRPDRVVYEITESGRAELSEWLAEPSPRTSGFRDDFFLKVVAATRSRDRATVEAVLRVQRAFLLREMRNLEDLRSAHAADAVVSLLLSAAARHVGADLAFLDDAETRLLADLPPLADPASPAERAATPRRRRAS